MGYNVCKILINFRAQGVLRAKFRRAVLRQRAMSDSPAGWTPEPNQMHPKLSRWLGPGFPKNVAMLLKRNLSETEILLFGIP